MTSNETPDESTEPAQIDTTRAHAARVYDYLLGGRANFEVDREAAERAYAAWPGGIDAVRADVREHRAALSRVVRYLVREAGITQFLDIGTGIPTANNTHEVAQRAGPDTRVVYVDNDPIVLAHARALLTGSPAGATGYVDADLRDTGTILAAAAQTLDFSQPVAVMLVGVLHCIPDEDSPGKIVGRLMDTVPAGSYLTISHPASDIHPDEMARGAALMNRSLAGSITFRPHGEVASFFAGLELVPPGLVSTTQWRPGPGTGPKPLPGWAGVAVKR